LLEPKLLEAQEIAVRLVELHGEMMDRIRQEIIDNHRTGFEENAPGWAEDEGLWTFQGRVYVPEKLREQVLQQHHDGPRSGHPGRDKTIELVLRNYWWLELRKDAERYVAGCPQCQRIKPRCTPARTPLHPFLPPSRPWELVTLDVIGPLPLSLGFDAILIIIDWYLKTMKLQATQTTITMTDFADILLTRIFRKHGLPQKLIHDQDPRFMAGYVRELLKRLGIHQNISTAYHPQTDGQTERLNQEVEKYLHTFINHCLDDWATWLATAEFMYNDHPHAATGYTPFYLVTGQHPWKGEAGRADSRYESMNERLQELRKVRVEAATSLLENAECMKKAHDHQARPLMTTPWETSSWRLRIFEQTGRQRNWTIDVTAPSKL
jgi:transposase InsO family protein